MMKVKKKTTHTTKQQPMIFLFGTKKHLTKSNLFLIKTFDKLGIEGKFLKVKKDIYEYATPNIPFSSERVKAFFPQTEKNQ